MIPTINHFIGQRQVTDRFRIALEATWNDGRRLPHTLLTGPPGTGKTTLAQLAARETGSRLIERIGQVLSNPSTVNALLMEARDGDVVFIDEIHEMPAAIQTLLYRAMEDHTVYLVGRDNRSLQLPVSDFILVAATTDEYGILEPLRDRFRLILPFTWYGTDELARIVSQHAVMQGLRLDDGVAASIAERARGTPRIALRLLESCHRYARSQGDRDILMEHFCKTVQLEGVDNLGLGPDERRYLSILAARPGQAVRLHTLSSSLGLHPRTLQTVVEPFLLRVGLVERTERGRVITPKGLCHLGLITDPQAAVA